MDSPETVRDRLQALPPALLRRLRRGVEKESLRVRHDGSLALTPHPHALGSALAHPHITTDFSESQLELITGTHETAEDCVRELTEIHQVVYRAIGDEILWCASMPCGLPEESAIPIGRYGPSNLGRMKTVYRTGLAHRYGRRMQMICGIHYNFSLPPAAWAALPGCRNANDGYFALIRNFRRAAWLLFYLYGASPAVCASFVADRRHGLQPIGQGTLGLPWATSLRMGRLGYQSEAQSTIVASANSLDAYGTALEEALTRSYAPYEAVGVQGPDGAYRQLATTLLQIENEFYGKIRPKRRIRRGERPLHALRERGVEYVEVRLMDLDPFEPVGISAQTMRFLDVFLLACLAADSPADTPEELAEIARNQETVAARGREPGLMLERGGRRVPAREWAAQILAACAPAAEALDAAIGASAHREAHAAAAEALADASRTPSARVLAAMAREHNASYVSFALARSLAHAQRLQTLSLSPAVETRFARLAEQSLAEQAAIEAADTLPFEEYRRHYLARERLHPGGE